MDKEQKILKTVDDSHKNWKENSFQIAPHAPNMYSMLAATYIMFSSTSSLWSYMMN